MENKDIKTSRDSYIDFLRAIGLLLLVVAHTSAPPAIAAIRTFDVPLMIFISALCYKPLRGGVFNICTKKVYPTLQAGIHLPHNILCS